MEKGVGNWDQRKDVENDEKDDGVRGMCCGAGRGNIQNMLIFSKELHRDVHYRPIYSRYIYDMIVAVEAARQGVTMGEDTVSGSMFADDFVGMSETPKGWQKQIEKALEYTRRWRVTANVKKCAVVLVVYNEDKVNPVNFKWKWGEDELPIADPYTYLGVEISKDCSWDAHIAKVIGKG